MPVTETDGKLTEAEKAYGLLWKDRYNEARRLLCDAIGKDGQRRGIQYALDTAPFIGKEQVAVTGIMLKNIGNDVIVEAEIGGQWVEVIRERADGAYSHIVEPSGMLKAYLNDLAAPSRNPLNASPRKGRDTP